MTIIRKKVLLTLLISGFGTALSVYITVICVSNLCFKGYIWPLLCILIPITLISAILLINEYQKLRIANVIIENQIFHIQSAYFLAEDSEKTNSSSPERMDIFISNFGILMDSKIIKFNQGGIQLKAVEIERSFISLTYGTVEKTQTIRLLHAEINSEEAEKIVENFYFEMGIVPIIKP